MAAFERSVNADFDRTVQSVAEGVLSGSLSASLTDCADFSDGNARCSIRVFERYSFSGGNRVSLSVTFFQASDHPIRVSAITAGGSQAVFKKYSTIGEESFLDQVHQILDNL